MQPYNLDAQIELLQKRKGFLYRTELAGLLAIYGRAEIVKALVSSSTGNVVSIAASPNWCRAQRPTRPTAAA
jgi:hypothetical protein